MNAEAELVWIEELQRRRERHIVEVWRLLNAWPRGVVVALLYGPRREAKGIIEGLERDMVQLKVEGGSRWVPLLQVDAIDGVEVETARLLPRPEVDGVIERVVAIGSGQKLD